MVFITVLTNALLVCLFVNNCMAVAIPTPEYPEVIPGPGLPSLESLGLTSTDLHTMRFNNTQGLVSRDREGPSLFKRIPTTCENYQGYTVSASNAQACINYLHSLGTNLCGMDGNTADIIFCTSGDANIWGSNELNNGQAVNSWCTDAATGAQNVINQCVLSNGQVEGYSPDPANSNILVSIEPYTYCD